MRSMRQVVASAVMMAVAGLPLLGGLSGCATAEKPAPVMQAVALPDLQKSGLKQVWERHIGLLAGETFKHAWRVGGSLYVFTNQQRLVRLDAKSGVMVFNIALSAESFNVFKPIELTAASGPQREVLVVTPSEVLVLDILTGDVRRSARFGISVAAQPVLVGDVLCVPSAGRVVAFSLEHLTSRLWTLPAAGDVFASTPAVIERDIVVASRKGNLWRVSTATGNWDWKDRKVNGEVSAGLALDSRAVYVPTLDQRVYAFSTDSGSELWQSQLEGTLDRQAVSAGSTVLVPSTGRGLFALAKSTGAQKWMAPGVSSVLTVSGDHVWVGDMQGNLSSLVVETGEIQTSAAVPEAQIFVRNTEDELLIVLNRSGGIGAYNPAR